MSARAPRRRPAVVDHPGRYTIADLTYDAETHTSRLPDGRDIPHVTTVLRATGLSTDFAEIAALSAHAGERVEMARLRGTAVHADAHAYDDGDLLIETVHPASRPYLDAWAECRAAIGLDPIAHARERRVYHPIFDYTGIIDGVFLWRGRRVLVDLKTGDPRDSACDLQTVAYDAAWRAQYPDLPIDERWSVQLVPRTRTPYRVENYSAWPDAHLHLGKWLACLCVFGEQRARGRMTT